MTIYLNLRNGKNVETVDEFTQNSDNDPTTSKREFIKYVNSIVANYHKAGMYVYKSQRCAKDWKEQ